MNNLVFEGNNITLILREQLRDVDFDGDFLMSGKEVAKILGYKNTNDAILRHVDAEDKKLIRNSMIDAKCITLRKLNNAGENFINESGMYSLILNSELESAKRFKRWVTNDVLPQIRQTGSYGLTANTIDETKVKLIVEKLALEHMINFRTDKVKETIKYLRAYGMTKAQATELAFKSMKYNMSADRLVEEFIKEQEKMKHAAYNGKIKLAVADLVKLGYNHQDAWNKFAEVASKATGIDIKELKQVAYKKKINTTYCNIVREKGIQKESLAAINRFITAEKRRIAKKANKTTA